jgi:hypothetical protein
VIGVFVIMAVWPLWSARFPPMQDYPMHLLEAQVLSAYDDPAFDYKTNFAIHLQPVYSSFYLGAAFLAKLFQIETAGKIALSVYPLLIAVIVWRLGRRLGQDIPPWGAVLFFPLAFNQQYFLGNVNYLLALAILVLGLLDFEDLLGDASGVWPLVRQTLWQVALFVTHPFMLGVYVALAVIAAMMTLRATRGFRIRVFASIGLATLLFLASSVISRETPTPADPGASELAWLPIKTTAEFVALMFGGMQRPRNVDGLALLSWGAVFAVVCGALIVGGKARSRFPRLHVALLATAALGLFSLPFRIGTYSYVNLRTSVIVYFLAALLVAHVRFQGWWRYALVGLAGLCMVQSIVKQARISAEINDIAPIVSAIPPNSRILPLVFDSDSPELDRATFDIHLHDHNYYHLSVGGGYNPYLPQAPIHPVRYRNAQAHPAPDEYEPERFSWESYAADYQYFLIRGRREHQDEYMARGANKVRVSGAWTLYQRRP